MGIDLIQHPQAPALDGRLATAVELIAAMLEHPPFQMTATTLVNELAVRLQCKRVSLSILTGRQLRVRVLSHSARFDHKTELINAIESAMQEALDQQTSIAYPSAAEKSTYLVRAHAELANRHGSDASLSIPLINDDQIIGVLTLEHHGSQTFDPDTIDLCESIAALAGPILALKLEHDRSLVQKIGHSLRRVLIRLFGPRYPATKLIAASILTLAALMTFLNGNYRVVADSTLEGFSQRAIVVPQDGFINQTTARAGDIVHAGDVLATLDDQDLSLQRSKWSSQLNKHNKEYRAALAQHERTQVRILSAQIDQAVTEIALLDEQLSRLKLTAPFDGVIVSGDLTQSLGAPVERGNVLFEVAPLNEYRVILNVDEREISTIAVGQHGKLALTGMPGATLPITVAKVTPVATAQQGQNYFRIEARLLDASETFRPGMEGIAKIDIGRRKLIWIWTHKSLDWLRLWVWAWWP